MRITPRHQGRRNGKTGFSATCGQEGREELPPELELAKRNIRKKLFRFSVKL